MKNYLENLKWRYATKKFDPAKKVSDKDLDHLLEAIQLSASSYGLQPYQVIVVENKEVREKLKAAAWNQSQITDASHVLVFASMTQIDKDYIDTYLNNIAEVRDLKRENLSGLEQMLTNTILKQSPLQQAEWSQNQAYIALGNFLSAAAEMRIDTCPMEGFDPSKFDEILELSKKGLTTAVIATLGYRSEEDVLQHASKVRKRKEDLIHHI
ncbi:MAG: NAD(P)H-dependent oxidoreductase [Gillisia sp.]